MFNPVQVFHLGTIAFGSLILAIIRTIRTILEYAEKKCKKFNNDLTRLAPLCPLCLKVVVTMLILTTGVF